MLLTPLVSALCAAAAVGAHAQTARIYVQPIVDGPSPPAPAPSLLAEVSYDMEALALASVASFDAPELPEGARLVRIGPYDAAAGRWAAGTTVAAADNFRKGYSPHVVLAIDARGRVVSAACKGVAIDAGHTRDFGPQAVVLPEAKGQQPLLNKPVVLSPEGKKVEPETERTFLQKWAGRLRARPRRMLTPSCS